MYSCIYKYHSDDTKGDTDQIEHEPLDLEVPVKTTLQLSKFINIKAFPKLTYSKLRTVARLPHFKSAKELLLGCIKRNMETPLNVVAARQDAVVHKTILRFKKYYCKENVDELLTEFQASPVTYTKENLKHFLDTKSDTYLKSIRNNPRSWEDTEVSFYNMFPKTDIKALTDDITEYDKIQTVVYHDRDITMYYSSIFLEIKRRLKTILKKNVIYADGYTPEEMQDFYRRNTSKLSKKYYLENDFSKYDKTQLQTIMELEYSLYRMLGLDTEVIRDWRNGHLTTTLMSRSLGIKIIVSFQRKSGDATTSLGNTLVCILTVCAVYDIEEFEFAGFLGDDSVICLRSKPQFSSISETFLRDFNLIAKYKVYEDYGYFLSYFIFEHQGQMFSRYDPFKRLIKLGKALKPDTIIGDVFQSFKDTCKYFNDQVINEKLMEFVNIRYEKQLNCQLPSLLYQLSNNFKIFSSLY